MLPIGCGISRLDASPSPYLRLHYTSTAIDTPFCPPSAYAFPISPLQRALLPSIFCILTPQPVHRPLLIRRVTLRVAVLTPATVLPCAQYLLESLVHRLAVPPPSLRPAGCTSIGWRRR